MMTPWDAESSLSSSKPRALPWGRPVLLVATPALLGLAFIVDSAMAVWVRTLQDPEIRQAMGWLTHLGNGGVDLGVAAAVLTVGLCWRNDHARRVGLLGLYAVASSGALTQVMKHTLCRSRPSADLSGAFHLFPCLEPSLASFPSGHATSAFALAAVLAAGYPATRPWVYGGAVLVAFTRVYLGAHFPSDVIAASGIGLVVGLFFAGRLEMKAAHATPSTQEESTR